MAGRKEPVHLRERLMKSGRSSLYLEINKDGMRRYEFLKLYITNGKSREQKQEDKRTWELAEAIRAKRVVELRNSRYGFTDHDNGKADLLLFIKSLAMKKNAARKAAYLRVGNFLQRYAGRDRIEFNTVDKDFVESFARYLDRYSVTKNGRATLKETRQLADGSKYDIFCVFSSIMNAAIRSGIIAKNPVKMVDSNVKPKAGQSNREYLTKEELKAMIETKAPEYTKTLFLFSCYTGLRYSDVLSLRWEHITGTGEELAIRKQQQKTGVNVFIPLNKPALSLLPERKEKGIIFEQKKHQVNISRDMKIWAKAAGINKNITFHCARHTFATLLLSQGADLYTVSKLLGHTNIKHTQIYAKVVDESRKKAVDLLPDFMDESK